VGLGLRFLASCRQHKSKVEFVLFLKSTSQLEKFVVTVVNVIELGLAMVFQAIH
jgi:hypothetical protein